MIRSTKNESISTLAKKRHDNGPLTTTGVRGESYELAQTDVTEIVGEQRDAFDNHSSLVSDFPSNAFNGTFE